jgi:4-amino-4-deoxy-L-arabinose transferase-like glycosyltransferase
VTPRINKRDLPWLALTAASFIFGLAISWERWGNPLVDCGREMNQPLRLARGEMLYTEVRHIYGPLSPYLNAGLYRIFGPSLNVLYADGILSAIIILALVYWVARQLMGRMASTAATLSVMWLCAFKQAGNYVLPYSYSALHGCALGLAVLALLMKAAGGEERPSPIKQKATHEGRAVRYLLAAGVIAGLAVLAKTEMGLAAIIAGLVAAALTGYPGLGRALAYSATFIFPAALVSTAVYWQIAERVGWGTLSSDSFLFLRNLSPELVYFNRRVSGLDQPLRSAAQMVGAVFRIASLAAIIAAVSLLLTRRRKEGAGTHVSVPDLSITDAGRARYSQLWVLLALSVLVFLSLPVAGNIDWDKGPYLAMPLLLAGMLIVLLARYQKQVSNTRADKETLSLIIITVYALASLARVILRVRSGGAYSSYLLPSSVIVFTYGWARPFANMFKDGQARRLARNMALGLILADAAATAGLLGYRYRARNTYPIVTPRGTMIAVPDLGRAMGEAIDLINRETAPGEYVAVMPEGTSLDFFTDRLNPLREEITTPGFLDAGGEERAIRQLMESNTRLVLVANRPTPEFGPSVFGRDYCQRLMQWVEQNYEAVAILGPDHSPDLQIGDRTFFIRAYRKREN